MEEDELQLDLSNKAQRKTLKIVLAINMFQVVMAGAVGVFAQSTGLLGAALDNLSDAAVYLVSLFAIGRGIKAQARAASLSGILLSVLGLGLAIEVIRRFVTDYEPIGIAMIITAIVNASTNVINMRLLAQHKDKGVHMKASMIFTENDMLVNVGIVLSGITVMIFKSAIPDLLIGLVVAGIVLWGGVTILKDARNMRNVL